MLFENREHAARLLARRLRGDYKTFLVFPASPYTCCASL